MRTLNDFHEPHYQSRVEEVKIDHLLRPGGNICYAGADDSRAVGGQNGMGRGQLVKVGEESSLDVQDFKYRLNHVVGFFDCIFQAGSECDVFAGLFGLLFCQFFFFHAAGQIPIDKGLSFFEDLLICFCADALVAVDAT